jgi:hypothetical protein
MPTPLPVPTDEIKAEPEIRISPQKARQGRMGKHTLTILVVSLVLAVIEGVTLGLIPTGMP